MYARVRIGCCTSEYRDTYRRTCPRASLHACDSTHETSCQCTCAGSRACECTCTRMCVYAWACVSADTCASTCACTMARAQFTLAHKARLYAMHFGVCSSRRREIDGLRASSRAYQVLQSSLVLLMYQRYLSRLCCTYRPSLWNSAKRPHVPSAASWQVSSSRASPSHCFTTVQVYMA